MTESPKVVDARLAAVYETASHWLVRATSYRRAAATAFSEPRRVEHAARANDAAGMARLIGAAGRPDEAEYARRRWSRFFLVTSSDGHVHSSMTCPTTFPSTTWGWLPDLSGETEAQAVEACGEKMCTVCFPSAPTYPAFLRSVAERETAEAAKAVSRCAGSGTGNHDGSGLRYASPRARCNVCGQVVSVTSTGRMRAHKVAAR